MSSEAGRDSVPKSARVGPPNATSFSSAPMADPKSAPPRAGIVDPSPNHHDRAPRRPARPDHFKLLRGKDFGTT